MENQFLALIRRAAGAGDARSDAELLAQFPADQTAFAELLGRHGPMVWGTCRQLLGEADAEDAFQATFLALIQSAARVRDGAALAAWLHGVAVRIALTLRRKAGRRRTRERTAAVPATAPSPAPDDWEDTMAAVHREVSALPDADRSAFVLCVLEGLTQAEAAARLGRTPGAVAGQVARAKKRLLARLAARGVGPGLAALGSVATGAVLSPVMAERVLGLPGADVPPAVMRLAKGGVGMNASSTRVIAAAALVGAALTAGLWAATAAQPGPGDGPIPPARAAGPVSGAKPGEERPPGEGRLLVFKEGKHLLLTSDGKPLAEVSGHPDKLYLHDPAISPNGTRVAFIANDRRPVDRDGNLYCHVFVRTLDGKGDGIKIDLKAHNISWAPDGKLLVVEVGSYKDQKDRKFTTWLVDVATKAKTRVDLPEAAQVFALTPDGKTFIASTYDAAGQQFHLSAISRDGATVTHLTETARLSASFAKPKLSPDGTKVLYLDADPDEKGGKNPRRFPRLLTYDLKVKKRERLADVPLDGLVLGFAWSPDSRRVAYSWKRLEAGVPAVNNLNDLKNPKPPTETETHVSVADANGQNAKTVLSAKGASGPAVTITDLDWR